MMVQSRLISEGLPPSVAAGAGLPTRSPLPVRDRIGRWSGDLPADVVRDVAQRLQAGERYDDISAAIGLRKRTGRAKCAEIANALGLAPERKPHEIFADQVCALDAEGFTGAQIAEKLGRTRGAVESARRRVIGRKYKVVRLTPAEHAKIDGMILDGYNQYEIAREVGCNQTLVSIRAKKLDLTQVRPIRPPCSCGKRAGHGGRCNLTVDAGHVRQRLLEGATAADIAREHDRTAQSFKPKYVQPIIDQLTADGHRCGCGRPFGHQFVCSVTMAGQRRKFTEDQRVRAADMVRQGAAVRAVREALGVTVNSGKMLVAQVRASLAAEGVKCPCGQPINHKLSCSARSAEVRARTAFRFASATAAKMTPDRRRSISKLARAGFGCKPICDRTGESEWRVDVLIAELRHAGLTPQKCATCENSFNHKGPCVLPTRCKCGRWRNHGGACRKPGPRLTVARGEKPPTIEPALRREAMLRYRDGDSIRTISDATGVSWGVVQRLVAYWRKKSPYEQKPCVCGRPARHPGGCIKNTPGAVSKLEKARIVSATLAGEMPHRIADRLGIHVQTVLKHSADTRDEMFAGGISCACGRPVGHPYWCSSKWDAYDQPRGRRPFPEPNESRAVEDLLRGEAVADIAKAVAVGTDSIWKLRRTLSDAQRAQRTVAIRARLTRGGKSAGNAIMEQIRAAVPRGIDGMVRDDIEAEIYLAVYEGRLEREQIDAAVKSFVGRGLSQWKSAFGPASLDQRLFEDGSRTLADVLGDDTAAQAIDEITIGEPDA